MSAQPAKAAPVSENTYQAMLEALVESRATSEKKIRYGRRIVKLVQSFCRLKRHHAVLDVGCGGGGPALVLTQYLSDQGRYEGLDIAPRKIAIATKVITVRRPNFRFQVIDVANDYYNPTGTQTADTYRFPFDDATFDVVLMNSVFTHMRPADVANYLRETARVLKPGGRCLISYFLINDEAEQGIASGKSGKAFAHHFDGYRADDAEVHERAISYDERAVRELYRWAPLRIVEPILYGSWCGRDAYVSHQDIVIAERPH
jgi:SAM-dependent methyltransferase